MLTVEGLKVVEAGSRRHGGGGCNVARRSGVYRFGSGSGICSCGSVDERSGRQRRKLLRGVEAAPDV